MARNLIFGSYKCSEGHPHSNEAEVIQCNIITKQRQEQQNQINHMKESNEHRRLEMEKDQQRRFDLELAKLERERERDRMKHEERMKQLDNERLQNKK